MRQKAEQEKIEKKVKKEREQIEKQLSKWQGKRAVTLAEIKAEVKQFTKKLKYHDIAGIEYKQKLNKQEKEVCNCQGIIQ
jgi:hypothetical protein